MTTPIVQSITDEVIAEIEASAKRVTLGGLGWYTELQLDDAIESSDDIDFIAKMTPDAAQRLIARLRAAEKDVERLNKLDALCESYGFQGIHEGNRWTIDGPFRDIRAAIDGMEPKP